MLGFFCIYLIKICFPRSPSNVDECKEPVEGKVAEGDVTEIWKDPLNLQHASNENCKPISFDYTSINEVYIGNLELDETRTR